MKFSGIAENPCTG